MGFLRVIFRQDNIAVTTFAAAVGSFMYSFGKNSYFGDKWIKYMGKKNEDGEPVPVETILKFRFESILQKFDFTDWNKNYIHMYISTGLDPEALGSCNLKQGIRIGVPEYYQRLSDDAIRKSVTIENEIIDWDSPAGKRLLESLKLDEYAQKYIIACNVALVEGNFATVYSPILPFALVTAYSSGSKLYTLLKLHRRPFVLSLAIYAVHITIFSALCLFARDIVYSLYYKAAEERVSQFGIAYLQGGIDYYEKKIERNKALRELLKDGRKHFTENGDEVGVFRVKGMLDTFKLILAKERVEEFVEMEQSKIIPTPNPNPHPVL